MFLKSKKIREMEKQIKSFRDNLKIKIKVKTNDGKFQELYACYVLDYISENELYNFLLDMNWPKDESKIEFLMGKKPTHVIVIEEPLSEEVAKLALIEYKGLISIKKQYSPSNNLTEEIVKGY